MIHYISSMPLWAIVTFVVGFFYTHVLIAVRFGRAAIDAGLSPVKSANIQLGIVFFFTAFFIYSSLLALNGVFDRPSIPPMAIICAGIPLAALFFLVVANTALFKKLLQAITLDSLITIHAFRIIGIFFILLYFYNYLPAGFAFSAGLGDVITAIFAYPVAILYSKGKSWRTQMLYAWNIFGIFDVVNLLIFALLILTRTIGTGPESLREIDLFPFCYFAAFAPAFLVFMHVLVFKKMNQLKKQQTIGG